ncbi:unnamed protein product [Cylicocyclus nassatus]|uniref:Uncharacterized protein n=1 Tax=Cylicocyclus nassatus TaxID=53992 RepID=A0AA36DTZ3_CYLNA|nr:unnamed protein product [Cylicocyclus nassatus]
MPAAANFFHLMGLFSQTRGTAERRTNGIPRGRFQGKHLVEETCSPVFLVIQHVLGARSWQTISFSKALLMIRGFSIFSFGYSTPDFVLIGWKSAGRQREDIIAAQSAESPPESQWME